MIQAPMNEETNGTHNSCNTSIYYNTPNPSGPISDHLRTGVLMWSFERCLQEIRHPFVCVVLFFLQKRSHVAGIELSDGTWKKGNLLASWQVRLLSMHVSSRHLNHWELPCITLPLGYNIYACSICKQMNIKYQLAW